MGLNKLKITSSILLASFSLGFGFTLTSCSDNGFYLANFESYMAPKLMTSLKSEYDNLNFRYYGTNEDLERSFVRNYDVAVPSSYLMAKFASSGKLVKLDWSKFNIKDSTGKIISNADEALKLFDPTAQTILTSIYDINGDGKIDKKDDNLLNYGVPYFLQDFIVGYKGEKLQKFAKNNENRWTDVINYFGKNSGRSKTYKKIAMIDDYRTVYSIPRLIETESSGSPNVNPNAGPKGEDVVTINNFVNTYGILSSNFTESNTFLLNSDSNFILNDFADPKGASVGIMYNGDLLYAIQGGDNGSEEQLFDENNVHFIRPKNTLIALDMLVINKNSKFQNEAYDIIKKIALEGLSKDEDITNTDDEDSYIYGPMVNFDYVQYTSPLEKITEYVLGKKETNPKTKQLNNKDESENKIQSTYFSYLLEEGYSEEFVKLCQEIYRIGLYNSTENPTQPEKHNLIEKDLSELNKSNMFYAYNKIRAKL
ncbi:type 2 periplasmic-binding domain-containing protein [Malacoplasma iowae]|uniref:ABC spermidine/putrescine transporter substrate-binding subunit n=1 Tax=Malacoplasma iowae DK-CPA TaxID=1394179 RepID=A0A084U483_MALIO|nr:hypothetical protein [Malacoplasma iowae]KFB07769.1 ABC spermidine/putrescine transporter substrate-binding subunit [Malacoplasma iowae DK-CPA]WPL38242.1 hypothetical protein QX182_01845 [Malacoplasma iowae]WPL40617.1 hypothetical protein QX184_03725 [Malacoplasma iowae]